MLFLRRTIRGLKTKNPDVRDRANFASNPIARTDWIGFHGHRRTNWLRDVRVVLESALEAVVGGSESENWASR